MNHTYFYSYSGRTISLPKQEIISTRIGGDIMVRTKTSLSPTEIVPMLKTVEQMSKYSGIGINKLRELINNGEIEYIQNGNRCLLADKAIWDWYNRCCVRPETDTGGD